jgi:hypothetical protein
VCSSDLFTWAIDILASSISRRATMNNYTIQLMYVSHYGWLPTVTDFRGNEVYRGEYRESAEIALEYAMKYGGLNERD